MCKRTFLTFILPLFFALFSMPVYSAGNVATPTAGESGCPAPAPTNLTVYVVSPTSATLVWIGPPGTGIYYEVGMYDNTDGVPLPSAYVTTENVTITDLPLGHCIDFKVRASYCSFNAADMGTWSGNSEGCLGVIIIDTVADFNVPGNNGTSDNPNYGNSFDLCLERSSNQPPATAPHYFYENGLLVSFTYRLSSGSYSESFGIGLKEDTEDSDLRLQSLTGSSIFSYDNLGNPGDEPGTKQVQVTYAATHDPVLLITYNELVNATSPYAIANTNLQVMTTHLSTLSHEGQVACVQLLVQPEKPNVLKPKNVKKPVNAITLTELPSPNPFSHSTTFKYGVSEPGPVDIRLYDALGRLSKVVWQNPAQEAGQYGVTVYGDGLPNGMYLLEVQTGAEKKVYALVKQD